MKDFNDQVYRSTIRCIISNITSVNIAIEDIYITKPGFDLVALISYFVDTPATQGQSTSGHVQLIQQHKRMLQSTDPYYAALKNAIATSIQDGTFLQLYGLFATFNGLRLDLSTATTSLISVGPSKIIDSTVSESPTKSPAEINSKSSTTATTDSTQLIIIGACLGGAVLCLCIIVLYCCFLNQKLANDTKDPYIRNSVDENLSWPNRLSFSTTRNSSSAIPVRPSVSKKAFTTLDMYDLEMTQGEKKGDVLMDKGGNRVWIQENPAHGRLSDIPSLVESSDRDSSVFGFSHHSRGSEHRTDRTSLAADPKEWSAYQEKWAESFDSENNAGAPPAQPERLAVALDMIQQVEDASMKKIKRISSKRDDASFNFNGVSSRGNSRRNSPQRGTLQLNADESDSATPDQYLVEETI